jgi:hypothetical protein
MKSYNHNGTVSFWDQKDDWTMDFDSTSDMEYDGSYSVSNTGSNGTLLFEIWSYNSVEWKCIVSRTVGPGETDSGTFSAITYYTASDLDEIHTEERRNRNFLIHMHWKLSIYRTYYDFTITSDREFDVTA